MMEIVGHAPIFLGHLLNNQNNNNGTNPANNNANNGNATIVITHEQVVEVLHSQGLDSASYDNNDKNVAIPGTVRVLEQVAEVGYLSSKHPSDDVHALDVSKHFLSLRLCGDSASPQVSALTQTQCETYHKTGYLVIPNALTTCQADELLNQTHTLMKRISDGGKGIIRHDISNPGAKTPSTVGRIIATFEPGDQVPDPFTRRIARLGCGVHQLPSFGQATHSIFNRSLAGALGYTDPRITQSQLIAKLAGVGGRITPHQDGCVSFTNSPSCLTFWYALEDCTVENGCLAVAAGTHLTEPLRQRLVRSEDGKPRFIDLVAPVWVQGGEKEREEVKQDEEHSYTPLLVKKGTLILFHGNLMHRSGLNKSSKNRIACIVEGNAETPRDSYMMPEEEGETYERL